MEREIDELEKKYVISHYRNLMTEEEIRGLSATSYKNHSESSSTDRAVVRRSIYERLMREHGDEITIARCECCGKIVHQSWKKRCAKCRNEDRS